MKMLKPKTIYSDKCRITLNLYFISFNYDYSHKEGRLYESPQIHVCASATGKFKVDQHSVRFNY